MADTAGAGNGINFLCQRCQQPLRLSSTLYSMDEHTLAELSLPISPAQNIDVESQVGNTVIGSRMTDICLVVGNRFWCQFNLFKIMQQLFPF